MSIRLKEFAKRAIKALLPYGIVKIYKDYIKISIAYKQYISDIQFHVYSIEESIDKIIKDKSSVVRFGDGEMGIIMGHSLGFQEYDKELADKLTEILESNEDNLLVCIPDVFAGFKKYKNISSVYGWKSYLLSTGTMWKDLCRKPYYYNAFLTRPYYIFRDGEYAKVRFEKIFKIYEDCDIVLVEGEYSRLGCNNDLFKNVRSIKRILCPSKNAYSKYKEILSEIIKQDRKNLILMSLGPTAKVLTYELYKLGYHVIDIGHLDIEYEWFLARAKEKIKIKDKFVNEVKDGDKDLSISIDETYENEIIARIK
jgi:glycosyltransferase family protein